MAGLGLGLQPVQPILHEVPREMIEEADRLGFPLVKVTGDTRFRDIVSYVYRSLQSSGMQTLRRGVSAQRQLLELLLRENPVEAIAQVLATLLDADVVLLDRRGTVLATSEFRHWRKDLGRLSARVWETRDRESRESSFFALHEDSHPILCRCTRLRGNAEYLLVVVGARDSDADEFAELTMAFAQRLLEVELDSREHTHERLRAKRAVLLGELLLGSSTSPQVADSVAEVGIPLGRPWRFAALRAVNRSSSGAPKTADTADAFDGSLSLVDEFLEREGLAYLSLMRDSTILLLLSTSAGISRSGDLRRLMLELAEQLLSLPDITSTHFGLSEEQSTADVARACQQARLALVKAQREASRVAVASYEELGLHYLALDALDDNALLAARAQIVNPLLEFDRRQGTDLFRTLVCYVGNRQSAKDTAAELFVHRNTLRDRLKRIERIIGRTLASTDGLVETYLAIRAADVLGARQQITISTVGLHPGSEMRSRRTPNDVTP